MELLHIYGPDGGELPSEDLSDRPRSVLICRGGDRIALSESAPAHAEVVAALVRNEDGWALASASPEVMVSAGPKSAPDMQLLPGLVCSIAGYSFRLERDQAASGCTLLWRYDRSKVVADAVVAGRNIVAENVADGRPCVNPALAGDTLFEFFPAADGVDVVTGIGEKRNRMSVSVGTLFSVGGFEAMYLSSQDAALAMKTASPFSWPSRKPRRGLLLGLLALVALAAVAGSVAVRRQSLRARLAAPQYAQQVEPMFGHVQYQDSSDRETIYEVQFYRALPDILRADPSPLAEDLIRIGLLPQFTNNTAAARRVTFLQDVTKIQQLVRTGRWDELKSVLDGIDEEMFTLSDAQDFRHDAFEVMEFVTVAQPEVVRKALDGSMSPEAAMDEWKGRFVALQKDNLFMTGVTLKRELARSASRKESILAFVAARGRLVEKGAEATADEIAALTDAFCDLRDQLLEAAYSNVLAVTVGTLREAVTGAAGELLKLPDGEANDIRISKLVPLADLAGQLGVEDADTEPWRTRAKGAGERLALLYQQLYQRYRLKASNDLALGMSVLDEMIAIGYRESPYYRWAVREKERISQK